MSRFVVVSGYFPPLIGGTSTVMSGLLGAFDPACFSVVAEHPDSFDGIHNATVPAGIAVHRIGVPAPVRRLPYGLRLTRWLRFALVPKITRCILAQRPERIIALYPSWPFLIAAARAARASGVPLFTYHMDATPDWRELAPPDRYAARYTEQRILRQATQRLVLTEALAADFRERFGLESIVVPHSIEVGEIPAVTAPTAPHRIVHTGVVEALQRASLHRIHRALAGAPELAASLTLSTPTAHGDLAEFAGAEIVTLPSAEVRTLQRSAAVLLAVLPFDGPHSTLRQTAFPTKVIEYMTSGVPILAHAPADSFFARHAREHGYALLVEEPSETALQAALQRLLTDHTLRQRLTQQAARTVREIYARPQVAAQFAKACGIVGLQFKI